MRDSTLRRPRRATLLALLLLLAVWLAPGGVLSQSDEATGDHPAPATSSETAASESHAAPEGDAYGEAGGGHASRVTPVLLGLVIILTVARISGWVAERVGQPAVLGELIAGVVIGNLALVGYTGLDFLGTNYGIEILAEIGVILLLFEVGLESNVREMLSVGWSSLAVAILGIVAPFFLGWGTSAWMLPGEETLVHVFIGATLCATSVGITARVLADLNKLQATESKIILGAAVIDDILGLVILGVVTGTISAANAGEELNTMSILWIVVKAFIFLFGAVVVGSWIAPRMYRVASRLRMRGMLLIASLVFCFLLSYLANAIELATIVGAFAAGLILDEVHYRDLADWEEHTLEDLLHPLTGFLVPIFFVLMGVKVDLSTFGEVQVLGFATLLTIVAIIGKGLCALGVVEKGLDRISVAVGMIPRGEVGLIFAGIGAQLTLHGERVISSSIFSAVVIMVIVTTLITPPVLKVTLARGDRLKEERRLAEQAASESRRRRPSRPAG